MDRISTAMVLALLDFGADWREHLVSLILLAVLAASGMATLQLALVLFGGLSPRSVWADPMVMYWAAALTGTCYLLGAMQSRFIRAWRGSRR